MNSKINILLVEDNPADIKLLKVYLKDIYGDDVIFSTALSLNEAINKVERNKFDVVMLDLTLPDSSGTETLTKLHHCIPETPIIVLTGMENTNIGINVVKMGAQDFLEKDEVSEKSLKKSISYSIERQKLLIKLLEIF